MTTSREESPAFERTPVAPRSQGVWAFVICSLRIVGGTGRTQACAGRRYGVSAAPMPRPETQPEESADPHRFLYSVVVPVFNSVDVVGQTVDRIIDVFEKAGLRYQLILVNDGSKDGSWEVIASR